ncbi:MAG TPA: hypothetical protein VNH19_17575 [Candidatus Limnocylindrales bacterium]|nr:hypothetical protein [Candidatus Limnocylindrales bacterium]
MKRVLIGVLVLGVAVAHSLWPGRVQLDWPTVALLGIFISIVAAREISNFLPMVKRLKLGEAEIEMQEAVQKLHQEVENAEESTGPEMVVEAVRRPDSVEARPGTSEEHILDVASRDKESAVVRLVIEIEKELGRLFQEANLGSHPPRTIREMVDQLVAKNVLSREAGKAIIEFRNVRNQVIHPTQGGTVPESVLVSAIDSGVRILRLLRSIKVTG